MNVCEEKAPRAAGLNQDVWSIDVLKRVNMRTEVFFFKTRILIGWYFVPSILGKSGKSSHLWPL